MSAALMELLKPEIDEQMEKKEQETLSKAIKSVMDSFGVTAEQAMDALKIPAEDQQKYLLKL